MVVEGQWRCYSVTLAWSDDGRDAAPDLLLRDGAAGQTPCPTLYELLNLANDECWTGVLHLLGRESKLMVFRYGLALAGGACAQVEQINHIVAEAIIAGERYYPAFQLVCWGGRSAGGRDADRHRRGLRPRLTGCARRARD